MTFKKWKWYVYIVQCKDDSYYTGSTWSVANREWQHSLGNGSNYTKQHGFKKLVYYEEFENLEEARNREHQIKDWNRKKKEKLIKGEWGKDW